MAANLLRRLLSSFLVLFGILVITFVLARLIPTHPCEMLLYEKSPPEVCEKFMRDKGLDKPIPVQLGIYIKDVFQGDFGNSIRFNRPAIQILVERLPASIELSLMAFLIAVAVGIPIGILSAIYNRTPFDSLMLIGANFGVSVPVFWLGLLLMFIFAVLLKDTLFWLPPSGRVSTGIISIPFYEVYEISLAEGSTMSYLLNFLSNHFILNSIITMDIEVLKDTLKHLILPAVTVSIAPLSIIARLTRSSLLEEKGKNYILAARAKGLRQFIALTKHGFPNAVLQIITIMGLQIGSLLSGAVLTEIIYGFPGLGRMLYESIVNHDYPVTQMITLVVAVSYILINLIVDLSYIILDPRIRLEK